MPYLAVPIAILALLAAPVGAISNGPGESVDRYREELKTLEADLDAGKKYKHADDETKRKLRELDEKLLGIVEPLGSFDELDTDRRDELIATQEELKLLLDEVDADRPICRAERTTGSNRRQVVCRTKREEEAMRARAEQQLAKPRGCTGPQCGRN